MLDIDIGRKERTNYMISFVVWLDMFILALILLLVFAMVLLLAIALLDYMLETNLQARFKKHFKWVHKVSVGTRRFIDPVVRKMDEEGEFKYERREKRVKSES